MTSMKEKHLSSKSSESHAQVTTLRINSGKIIWSLLLTCLAIEIALFLADAFINYGKLTEYGMIRRFFNIAREDGLATWFGVTQTWMVALTLWLIYFVVRSRPARKMQRMGWLILAVFFMYMAMDDGAGFHERMGSAFEKMQEQRAVLAEPLKTGESALALFPSYPWQLLFGPLFAAFGIFMLWFLRRELKQRGPMLLIGLGLLMFVVSVGMDFIEGLEADHPWNLHSRIRSAYHLTRYDVRHFSKAIEEFLEMFGTTLIWVAFLRHFSHIAGDLHIRFAKNPSSPLVRPEVRR
jgi:hypothetical protein